MSRAPDSWYVRFPDGRVMRASSTAAVRHHLEAGRIPTDSRVRRSAEEEWTTLAWTAEFADLAAQRPARGSASRPAAVHEVPAADSGASGRAGNLHLQTAGVRGLAEELLAALDSTLVRSKLAVAAQAAFLSGLALAVAAGLESRAQWAWLPWLVAGLVCLALLAGCAVLLTQMTFVEVSQLRPARWAEVTAGFGRHVFRLSGALLLVGGTTVAALVLLREAPAWIIDEAENDWLTGGVTALALLLQVLVWPVLGFALLLAPVILIEDATLAAGLRMWWGLLRRQLSRVFLYEAMACAVAGVAALPFVLPVALTFSSAPLAGLAGSIAQWLLLMLTALALTPLIAYLFVANVFIFLHLRYEHTPLSR